MTRSGEELADEYILIEFNGETFPGPHKVATLKLRENGDKFDAIIRVSNTMRGSLRYENGKLSGSLMSTRMMGSDMNMRIEKALSAGFAQGMDVSRQVQSLVLSHKDDTMRFVLASGVVMCDD